MKYHYFHRFYLFDGAGAGLTAHLLALQGRPLVRGRPASKTVSGGSLAGAAHLSNDNAGVLRRAQRERKSRVEQKGKSSLDFDFQCEYEP